MIVLKVDANKITILKNELITSGSVNVNSVRFIFSDEWFGLNKTVIFSSVINNKEESYVTELKSVNEPLLLPWELLKTHGHTIKVGVYGETNGRYILPTLWKTLGMVYEGVDISDGIPSVPFDPEEPPFDPDDPTQTTYDHRRLTHRDDPDQHSIEAITNLKVHLDDIYDRNTRMSNSEIDEILQL